MGKIVTILNNKVLDWRYKKRIQGGYTFYIDDILVGTVSKSSGRDKTWTAINHYNSDKEQPRRPNMVKGFSSRYYACDYLITLNRLHDGLIQDDIEREEQNKRFEEFCKKHKEEK